METARLTLYETEMLGWTGRGRMRLRGGVGKTIEMNGVSWRRQALAEDSYYGGNLFTAIQVSSNSQADSKLWVSCNVAWLLTPGWRVVGNHSYP